MLLSKIASLFNPPRWIEPVIMKAKMLMQEMWTLEKKWDDKVPNKIHTEWKRICKSIIQLE